MPLLTEIPVQPDEAFRLASERGLLPTSLGTAEIREQFERRLRGRSVFSARTTSAEYLTAVKTFTEEMLRGETDLATVRWKLGELLDALGYTPEGGFPDAPEGAEFEPAESGSLQDLRSVRRRELVIRTQVALHRGAGLQERGMQPERLRTFPAWELVRVGRDPEAPRAWRGRWATAGGKFQAGSGRRMIAGKHDPIWEALGDPAIFDDALDVDHSPFAFGSGMRQTEVSRNELGRLGIEIYEGRQDQQPEPLKLPKLKKSVRKIPSDWLAELKADLKAEEDANGVLTMDDIRARGKRAREAQR